MQNFIGKLGILVASLVVIYSTTALADSPVKIDQPDAHSVEVKGKVNLYRVQVEGMNFGEGKNKANAEVFVTLDSKPGMIYTLALHKNGSSLASVVNQEMAKTLRAAYVSKAPVTLYHQISMKQDNNYRILMVQMD
ncbi:hypothetical protein [Kaarinaea lacus]